MSADGSLDKAAAIAQPVRLVERARQAFRANRRRYLIMASVPLLLLLVGGWMWLSGGRYVSHRRGRGA
jgi:hypothetical protein